MDKHDDGLQSDRILDSRWSNDGCIDVGDQAVLGIVGGRVALRTGRRGAGSSPRRVDCAGGKSSGGVGIGQLQESEAERISIGSEAIDGEGQRVILGNGSRDAGVGTRCSLCAEDWVGLGAWL